LVKTLIVVVAARLSEWIEKGEITGGYFNPDGRFDRIFVVSLVEDTPSFDAVEQLCGVSDCHFVNLDFLSVSGLLRTVGFLPSRLKRLLLKSVAPLLSREENVVVRSYGDTFSGMVAAILANVLKCRSVAGIHTTFTYLPDGEKLSLKHKLLRVLEKRARDYTHKKIDVLAPVYSPAIHSISPDQHHKTYVVPNSVDVGSDNKKTDYSFGAALKVVSVGRLVSGKTLIPVLEGLQTINEWHLTIVGDGPFKSCIETWLALHGLEEQVTFVKAMPNKELVSCLSQFDVFAAYTAYAEIPKTVIEAGLAGLPIILNRPVLSMPDEYRDAPVLWADGASPDYGTVFADFISCGDDWERTGRNTRDHFEKYFEPVTVGKMMADLLLEEPNDRLQPWNKDKNA
tara:strand:- start:381 stop:1574 length:1194 start_codon:yes stop_codon:yes gene_type:complete